MGCKLLYPSCHDAYKRQRCTRRICAEHACNIYYNAPPPAPFLFFKSMEKDLCFSLLHHASVKDVACLALTCVRYRRNIFHNDAFWMQVLMNRYPQPGWRSIVLEDRQALHILLDGCNLKHVYRWLYLKARIEAPLPSQLHLRFYMRIDTTDMPSVLMTGALSFSFTGTHYTERYGYPAYDRIVNVTGGKRAMYARDKNGKLLIGKLNENRLRKSDDTLRKDRNTNNNGLTSSYESEESEEERSVRLVQEEEAEKVRPKVKRIPFFVPRNVQITFQKADKTPIALWREHDGAAYFGRISKSIMYALDRSVSGPMLVKDIANELDGFTRSVSLPDDDKYILQLAHKDQPGMFDVLQAMKHSVQLSSIIVQNASIRCLFKLYGTK